jgi:uncharacterized protein YndB with AHSA1/START domain
MAQMDTRSFEMELEIEAPVDAVWKALSDARELERWFPLEAKVTPGAGGALTYSWGGPFDGTCQIEIWEPNTHLRTTWPFAPKPEEGEEPHRVLVDYFLESRGGKTMLRVVHSGFGRGAKWDAEYDGVSRGWAFELRGMRHYLENHRGTPRQVIWCIRPVTCDLGEAWNRVMGDEGLRALSSLKGATEGTPYKFTTVGGDMLEGRVGLIAPPRQFAATISNLNNAWMRVEGEACSGNPTIWLWASTYGVPRETVEATKAKWDAMLDRLFGKVETPVGAHG